MEIIFIRHGEKCKNISDPPLTKKGEKQANYVATRLKKEKISRIYCSNLKRSFQTASIINKKLKLKLAIEHSLNEFDSSILKKDKNLWEKETKKRYLELKLFLDKISKKHDSNEKILIVAHGITNRLILSIYLELELTNLIRLQQTETGMNEIYWEKRLNNWRLKYWNDSNHLPESLKTD